MADNGATTCGDSATISSMKSDDIREKFLQFFEHYGHTRVPSSPLAPANDPTLLFTNSGMAQFKDVFLGFDERPYKTAVTAQRCLRAGGKHNDLENVGYTARHHTFFEMLGNFSFGQYFKEKAIPYAWEFLTSPQWLNIPKEHLWITVFGGGQIFGENFAAVPADNDAYALWKETLIKSGFSEQEAKKRVTNIPTTDNFWMMGDTGPCGPCSEIFYDRDIHAARFRGEDSEYADECVEVWNLVFMEFNRDNARQLHKLPAPCVDTGMGLERICAVMQAVDGNYDIDLFQKLLANVNQVITAAGGVDCRQSYLPSHRVVADHIRAAAFLIADDILPDNEGRGYVLRKIIRRGLIHGNKASKKQDFGIPPWFYQLVDGLIPLMDSASDIIAQKAQTIKNVLEREERAFFRNFTDGRLRLENKINEQIACSSSTKLFPGAIAFELYDTYGFPVEATIDEVKARGFENIDYPSFEKCMAQQRARSQAATKFNAEQSAIHYDGDATNFVGYETFDNEAAILAIYVNGKSVTTATANEKSTIILDNTPFYAESGGQIGDTGIIKNNNGLAEIINTQKIRADVWGHITTVKEGAFNIGDKVTCHINKTRRLNIARNHSATHLMHAALRQILGVHVRQKGSLVAADYLRFDFSHHEALSHEQWREVENIVNKQIRANDEVIIDSLKYDDAINRGAMALFGEKYGDVVRMVTIDKNFSIELCGGAHVKRVGEIGFFHLITEGAIAAGIRRIEAVSANAAIDRIQHTTAQLGNIAVMMKAQPEQIIDKITQLRDSLKAAQKQIQDLNTTHIARQTENLISQAKDINGMRTLIIKIPNGNIKTMRDMISQLRDKMPHSPILLAADDGGKAFFVAATGDSKINANQWIQTAAKITNAKGGGKADYAQAGGGDADKIDAALTAAEKSISDG